MGGGTDLDQAPSIHYGVYGSANCSDTSLSMQEASLNSLLMLADRGWAKKGLGLYYQSESVKILELGSGTGFAAHNLAQKLGSNAEIHCVNICPNQNGACS